MITSCSLYAGHILHVEVSVPDDTDIELWVSGQFFTVSSDAHTDTTRYHEENDRLAAVVYRGYTGLVFIDLYHIYQDVLPNLWKLYVKKTSLTGAKNDGASKS